MNMIQVIAVDNLAQVGVHDCDQWWLYQANGAGWHGAKGVQEENVNGN